MQIDLSKIETKINGFWTESGNNNPVTTKFNNFLPETEASEEDAEECELDRQPLENNRNRSASFDLDQMFSNLTNFQYQPTYTTSLALTEKPKIYRNIEESIEQNKSEIQAVSNLIEDKDSKPIDLVEDEDEDESEIIAMLESSPAADEIDKMTENQSIVFPGEVISDQMDEVAETDLLGDMLINLGEDKKRVTCLDISTKKTECQVGEDAVDSDTYYDDAVAPFQLDSDHDYSLNLNKPRFNFTSE